MRRQIDRQLDHWLTEYADLREDLYPDEDEACADYYAYDDAYNQHLEALHDLVQNHIDAGAARIEAVLEDTAVLYGVVKRIGLRTTVEKLAALCFEHARIEDEYMQEDEKQSPFHGAGRALQGVVEDGVLPSEPFFNDTIFGTPAKNY